MATLGGFILAYGFFAFNLASHRSLSQPTDGTVMGQIAVNCILSGSGGSLTAVITQRCLHGKPSKWSLITALNGCLAGMVRTCRSISTGMHAYIILYVSIYPMTCCCKQYQSREVVGLEIISLVVV